jgi:hypothetical protein
MKNKIVDLSVKGHPAVGKRAKVSDLKESNFERNPSKKFVEITLSEKDMKNILGQNVSIRKILKKKDIGYPTYYYGLINTANKTTGATRSCNVGKMHSLIKELNPKSLPDWKRKHSKLYPDAFSIVRGKILSYLSSIGIQDSVIQEEYSFYVDEFINNLLFEQTYSGLKIQEIIIRKVSSMMRKSYHWSAGSDDSKGIDGYIGDIPVSIKPKSCGEKKAPGVKRIDYTIDNEDNSLTFTLSF